MGGLQQKRCRSDQTADAHRADARSDVHCWLQIHTGSVLETTKDTRLGLQRLLPIDEMVNHCEQYLTSSAQIKRLSSIGPCQSLAKVWCCALQPAIRNARQHWSARQCRIGEMPQHSRLLFHAAARAQPGCIFPSTSLCWSQASQNPGWPKHSIACQLEVDTTDPVPDSHLHFSDLQVKG